MSGWPGLPGPLPTRADCSQALCFLSAPLVGPITLGKVPGKNVGLSHRHIPLMLRATERRQGGEERPQRVPAYALSPHLPLQGARCGCTSKKRPLAALRPMLSS